MHLAATIDQFSDEFSTEDMTESYPETVFGIAEALLLWHDANLGPIDTEVPAPARKKSKNKAKERPIKTARKKK